MGLINFLKGVDIDKQRKQLFIDPFDKGSKTTVYNIGRNGSATILFFPNSFNPKPLLLFFLSISLSPLPIH